MNVQAGSLYMVATPIGNLADITLRALEVLAQVDVVACEDTRVTQKLMAHHGLHTPLISFHDHNESQRANTLVRRMLEGQTVAVVSDAGTPLVSDPGYRLVKQAREAGLQVYPIPGASAVLAAVSVAGLPVHQFHFVGFLPAKRGARQEQLQRLAEVPVALVFFLSPHSVLTVLEDMEVCLGCEREVFVGRELTKRFESHYGGTWTQVKACLQERPDCIKGEWVVVVAPDASSPSRTSEAQNLLQSLRPYMPLKHACRVVAEHCQCSKNALYRWALEQEPEGGTSVDK